MVEGFKPEDRPAGMTAEPFAGLPETIPVRELRYGVSPRGFRTRSVTQVDAEAYSLKALAEPYGAQCREEQYFHFYIK
jgi:hypothetical protein